jgi:hypothetical protein
MGHLPKIYILIIYSPGKNYDKMLKIQQPYYEYFQKNLNIKYYFIQFREQDEEITIDENKHFIYVKGKEGEMNILKKTVESMKYIIKNDSFDYLIRTNISTIIDIYNLLEFCKTIPRKKYYGGGHVLELKWGNNYLLYGTFFIQGTGIIFSRDIVEDICENESSLEYKIIDDVSIGIYIKKKHPDIFETTNKYSNQVAIHVGCKCHKQTENIEILKKVVFFRNRTICKRGDDIIEMQRKTIEIMNKERDKEHFFS